MDVRLSQCSPAAKLTLDPFRHSYERHDVRFSLIFHACSHVFAGSTVVRHLTTMNGRRFNEEQVVRMIGRTRILRGAVERFSCAWSLMAPSSNRYFRKFEKFIPDDNAHGVDSALRGMDGKVAGE